MMALKLRPPAQCQCSALSMVITGFSTGFYGKERLRRMGQMEDQLEQVGGPSSQLPGPTPP